MLQAWAFIAVAVLLCLAAVLAIILTTNVTMGWAGADAVARDGLARGAPAPAWLLEDQFGSTIRSPSGDRPQLIAFTDHSLRSFPSVAEGLRAIAADRQGPEVVVLLRQQSVVAVDLAADTLGKLGLANVRIVAGTPSLYWRYNVRVMPFVIFVDQAGRVTASSLVNHDWQVARLGEIAAMPLTPHELAAPRGFRRLRSQEGV